jgi:hypothetical protein
MPQPLRGIETGQECVAVAARPWRRPHCPDAPARMGAKRIDVAGEVLSDPGRNFDCEVCANSWRRARIPATYANGRTVC